MNARPQVEHLVDRDIVGIEYACIEDPQVARSGYIPEYQYAYTAIEIFKEMVVGKAVGDKYIVEFGPLVTVCGRNPVTRRGSCKRRGFA